ncbi:hypothetical protein GV764_13500 [Atlantibacter hermannii]|nr:hypothetical protein [Atlantibacter hermannii]NBD00031.1 hypothetical protein [Atlantibacter hermannii]
MNDDEQVRPNEIHHAIGKASHYLMQHSFPVTAENLLQVLHAQDVMSTEARHKAVLASARQYLKLKMLKD